MRLWFFLACLIASGSAQTIPSLPEFLGLSGAQIAAVRELNQDLDQVVAGKQGRQTQLRAELSAEYAKPAPDPLALGQRYLEIDALDREIAAARAATHAKVLPLLQPNQAAILPRLTNAILQQQLARDASCAFLNQQSLAPNFFSVPGSTFAGFLLGVPTALRRDTVTYCPADFPLSIRNLLNLSDAQVATIASFQSSLTAFNTQKQNRTADVQVEIRDELAKPVPDPLALGVRYQELADITQEQMQADLDAHKSARAALNPQQQTLLQAVLESSSLLTTANQAQSCHFLSETPGISGFSTTGVSCALVF